jgi:DNA repair exonuclease SbcCD nuclease subunit
MSTFRFIHAADIHLDSPLSGLSRYEGLPADEVRRATRGAFDNLVEAAIGQSVDFVIIAGDLFDGDWKDMGTGLYFARAMAQLAHAGIPVYLLKGNHDAESAVTRTLPLPETVRVFTTRKAETFTLPDIGVALHGRSFPTVHVDEDLTRDYPPPQAAMFNIGVLHTSVGGYAQHATYAPCTVQGLAAKGYDYWALGHVHDYEVLSRDPWIVFPGNLQGRNARETGPKGAVLVEVSDGEVTACTHLPLDVLRWLRVEVDCAGAETMHEVRGRLRVALARAVQDLANSQPAIARVTLIGETTLAGTLLGGAATLRDEVRALAIDVSGDLWIEKVRVETATPAAPTSTEGLHDAIGLLEDALQSPELLHELTEDFRQFIDTAPADIAEPGSLQAQVRADGWDSVIELAASALRNRLTGSAG